MPRDETIEYISYFPNHAKTKPLQNIWYFLRTFLVVRKSDAVIVGGGGLLYDNEDGQSFDRLLSQWKLRVRIVEFL